jgi:hypothetical protein
LKDSTRLGQNRPSTTWEWKLVKVRSAPERDSLSWSDSRLKGFGVTWGRAKPVTLHVHYRGGAESSWLVTVGGGRWRFPGHMALEDVMARCYREVAP